MRAPDYRTLRFALTGMLLMGGLTACDKQKAGQGSVSAAEFVTVHGADLPFEGLTSMPLSSTSIICFE